MLHLDSFKSDLVHVFRESKESHIDFPITFNYIILGNYDINDPLQFFRLENAYEKIILCCYSESDMFKNLIQYDHRGQYSEEDISNVLLSNDTLNRILKFYDYFLREEKIKQVFFEHRGFIKYELYNYKATDLCQEEFEKWRDLAQCKRTFEKVVRNYTIERV